MKEGIANWVFRLRHTLFVLTIVLATQALLQNKLSWYLLAGSLIVFNQTVFNAYGAWENGGKQRNLIFDYLSTRKRGILISSSLLVCALILFF